MANHGDLGDHAFTNKYFGACHITFSGFVRCIIASITDNQVLSTKAPHHLNPKMLLLQRGCLGFHEAFCG